MLGDDKIESDITAPAPAGNTSEANPPEKEKSTTSQGSKDNLPDRGSRGEHLAVQGVITFKLGLLEYVLSPWHVVPFSAGYEFLGQAFHLLYHRGVYRVDMHGNPVPTSKHGNIAFAKGSYGYVTPADSIAGFSGAKYKKCGVAVETAYRIRDWFTRLDDQEKPWAALPENQDVTLDEVLPQFWVELEEPHHPDAPFETMLDLSTQKKIRVVRLKHWHLLAPVPGATKEQIEGCCQEQGWRFMSNRIYVSGTGLRPTTNHKLDAPYRMDDLASLASLLKLKTVLLPCVDPESGKTEGGLHDLFSSPSATALRNLLGDQVIPGNSVFA